MISYTKDVIRGGDSRPGFSVYSPADSPVRALSYPWRAPGFSLWKSLELVAEVENLTLTDQLTGLPNRRALFQRLDSEDNRLNRYGGKMSLVMMDMTGFKEINDSYGHLMGDAALQAASHCVRECLRESDFVARFGGDEFVVLMPETGVEEAAAATSRSSEKLVKVRVSGIPLKLTAHFGLSRYPEDGKKLAAVLKKADDRMCEGKTRPGYN